MTTFNVVRRVGLVVYNVELFLSRMTTVSKVLICVVIKVEEKIVSVLICKVYAVSTCTGPSTLLTTSYYDPPCRSFLRSLILCGNQEKVLRRTLTRHSLHSQRVHFLRVPS